MANTRPSAAHCGSPRGMDRENNGLKSGGVGL